MFEVGDVVVHPVHGAGVVIGFKKFEALGDLGRYYSIKVLSQSDTNIMVPIQAAEKVGVRYAISPTDLRKVWEVLYSIPEELPDQHKTRYKILNDKLSTGNIFKIAEALRDMASRKRDNNFTQKGRQIYDKTLQLLASEVAACKHIAVTAAEDMIRHKLGEAFPVH
ncbi:MAG: hypothetical protein JW981_05165 [Anaerolineae bacterium]|nr:hypothetical protein [Anaerolineae bacterium]